MAQHQRVLVAGFLVAALLCGVNRSEAEVLVPSWVKNALRAQTLLAAETDVSRTPVCGANDVLNQLQYSPSQWRQIRPQIAAGTACLVHRCLKGATNIHSQDYSVADLLTMGVRRLGMNLHFTPTVGTDPYRFCRGDPHFFTGCNSLRTELVIDVCASLFGVPTLSVDSTGCSASSRTVAQGFKEISDWINANTGNLTYDVIIIDVADFVTAHSATPELLATANSTIRAAIKDSLQDLALTVTQLKASRMGGSSTSWPTPTQIVDTYKKRVILTSAPNSVFVSEYVHARSSPDTSFASSSNSVKQFRSMGYLTTCPLSSVAFRPIFESRKVLELNETMVDGSVVQVLSQENGPDEFGTIDKATAARIAECGFTPSLDHVSLTTVIDNCIWSYSANIGPPTNTNQVVVFNAVGGWTTVDKASAETLRRACRNADGTMWELAPAGQPCQATLTFSIPASPAQAAALRRVLTAAQVPSALLPSNVPGVTEPMQSTSGSSNALKIGLAVGLSVAVVIIVLVVAVVIAKRRSSGPAVGGDTDLVVTKSDLEREA